MQMNVLFVIGTAVVAWTVHRTWKLLYDIYLHPLKTFPGPRVAAATAWYETWQELILNRCWIDVLQELHKQYGEVVRVGPSEVCHRHHTSI